jgi:Transposase, Mutator family
LRPGFEPRWPDSPPNGAQGASASGGRSRRCFQPHGINAARCTKKSQRIGQAADLGAAGGETGLAPDLDQGGPQGGNAAINVFAEKYGAKNQRAVACLVKGSHVLLTFHDFPAEHWDHLRTANAIESVFATVRHRTVRTRGALSEDTAGG